MAVTEAARVELIEQTLTAAGEHPETLRVPWRGQQERLPIIRIRLSATILNPRSHRIKAQLESNQPMATLVNSNPDGDEAQNYIATLLRATPGFAALKQNLEDEGQKEAGIVTRNGLLVNANTRAVALADAGIDYIEVAVLPADAQPDEIYDLELDLQVAQDYRQDYSFTNELLFIDDLIAKLDRNESDVALRLRWATSTNQSSMRSGIEKVRRYVRHLVLIRDIQRISGESIPITYFDDAAQTLQEFDAAYESLRDKDPRSAERLKQGRILGLLVDLGYDRQRAVNAEWMETYLADALAENELLQPLLKPIVEAKDRQSIAGQAAGDDFDLFEGGDDLDANDPAVFTVVARLVEAMSTSAQASAVTLPTVDGEKSFSRDQVKEAVNDAMRTAAEDARAAARAGNSLNLPAQLVTDAATRLRKAREAYERVRSRSDFSDNSLREGMAKLARAFESLNETVGE